MDELRTLCSNILGTWSGSTEVNNAGKVLGYARVSTELQRDKLSIALQFDKIKAWATLNDYPIKVLAYDNGISGTLGENDRPGLKHVLSLAKKGDIIVISNTTRLTRDQAFFHTTLRDLGHRGVYIIATDNSLDTMSGGAIGKLSASLQAMMAEYEGDIIRQRVKDGMAKNKQAKGTAWGTNERFGYRWMYREKPGRNRGGLVPYEPEHTIVRKICEYASGQTLQSVADYANALPENTRTWYPHSIRKLLMAEGVDRK